MRPLRGTAARVIIRTIQPAARLVELRLLSTGETLPMTRRNGVIYEAAIAADRLGVARLPPARHLSRRPRRRDRRSVSLRARADRFRPAPVRRRARTIARSRSSARIASRVGIDDRRALRGVGAQRASASASSATSTAGTAASTRCGSSCRAGVWELFVPDLPRRRALQVRDPHAGRRAARRRADPFGVRVRGAAAHRVGRPRHLAATQWHDDDVDGARGERRAAGSTGRCRSTKCISARGRACPRKATAS